jgi:CDP-6-deoxy-D-xylo-4-hexulose-3-dehydrase
MNFKFPLSTSTWGKEEYAIIQSVIDSGMFTMGKYVNLFEKNFAKFVDSKYCVMVNSGSSANLLMVASLFYTKNSKIKLKHGDEVIVPAVSWSTTYYPLYQYGLKIKFVDIDLNTLNYDLEQLELAVTNKTRMIMAVNLLGNPNDFDRLYKIIGERDIILIEDNCESLGAKYKKKYTGTFGLMGSYSSFFSHHICTMEGGLIVTDNEELYHILLSLRAHGWTRELPKNNYVCGVKSDDLFEELFHFVLPGFNVRPLELEGAVGLEQLKRLPNLLNERRKNGKLLQQKLQNSPNIIIQQEIEESSWFGFSLVIRPGSKLKRKELLANLNKVGFECRPIVTGNFTKNEVVKYFNYEIHKKLKNAEYIDKNGLFVGNHHYSISEAIDELQKI